MPRDESREEGDVPGHEVSGMARSLRKGEERRETQQHFVRLFHETSIYGKRFRLF